MEKKVVGLRADGVAPGEIGRRLNINIRTVQNYLSRAAKKKNCDSLADLMIYVWRRRIEKAVLNAQESNPAIASAPYLVHSASSHNP